MYIILLILSRIAIHAMPFTKWENQIIAFKNDSIDVLKKPEISSIIVKNYGFGLDIPVIFRPLQNDPTASIETIRVSIVEYDPERDIYLGYVAESPKRLKSVKKDQNVIFKFGILSANYPVAISDSLSYDYPPKDTNLFVQNLYKGIKAYRSTDYGRNSYGFESCNKTIKEAISMPGDKRQADLALSYYLLARCYTDYSLFDSSLAWYKRSLLIDSSNTYAIFSLISDYSIAYQEARAKKDSVKAAIILDELRREKEIRYKNQKINSKIDVLYEYIFDKKDPNTNLPKNIMRWKLR